MTLTLRFPKEMGHPIQHGHSQNGRVESSGRVRGEWGWAFLSHCHSSEPRDLVRRGARLL